MNCPDCGLKLSDTDLTCPRCEGMEEAGGPPPPAHFPALPLARNQPSPTGMSASAKPRPLRRTGIALALAAVVVIGIPLGVGVARESHDGDAALITVAIAGLTDGDSPGSTSSQFYRDYCRPRVMRQDDDHAEVDFSSRDIGMISDRAVRVVRGADGQWKATAVQGGDGTDAWKPVGMNASGPAASPEPSATPKHVARSSGSGKSSSSAFPGPTATIPTYTVPADPVPTGEVLPPTPAAPAPPAVAGVSPADGPEPMSLPINPPAGPQSPAGPDRPAGQERPAGSYDPASPTDGSSPGAGSGPGGDRIASLMRLVHGWAVDQRAHGDDLHWLSYAPDHVDLVLAKAKPGVSPAGDAGDMQSGADSGYAKFCSLREQAGYAPDEAARCTVSIVYQDRKNQVR